MVDDSFYASEWEQLNAYAYAKAPYNHLCTWNRANCTNKLACASNKTFTLTMELILRKP